MSEQHPYRAAISPVPQSTSRPLWSVMIPTYNCANYLRETLASVLAQDPGAEVMQIAVIDDHSTQDDPAAVVEELGRGRVEFYQQPENVGNTKNYATSLQRSRGRLIHLLHGDDCVRDGFYLKMQQLFEKKPDIGAAFCRHITMNENSHWQFFSELEQQESGILNNWLETIATIQRIQTPSIVVRRDVYEQLGGFDQRLRFVEDWEMWVRIAANYSVGYEVEPLALYRAMRSGSLTNLSRHSGENVQEIYKAIQIYQSYLPNTLASQLPMKAKERWAFCILEIAQMLFNVGDRAAAMAQIREVLKYFYSFKVFKRAAGLVISQTMRQAWRTATSAIQGRENISKFPDLTS